MTRPDHPRIEGCLIDGARVRLTFNDRLEFQAKRDDGRTEFVISTRDSYGFSSGAVDVAHIWATDIQDAHDQKYEMNLVGHHTVEPAYSPQPIGWSIAAKVAAGDWLATLQIAERFKPVRSAAE